MFLGYLCEQVVKESTEKGEEGEEEEEEEEEEKEEQERNQVCHLMNSGRLLSFPKEGGR